MKYWIVTKKEDLELRDENVLFETDEIVVWEYGNKKDFDCFIDFLQKTGTKWLEFFVDLEKL